MRQRIEHGKRSSKTKPKKSRRDTLRKFLERNAVILTLLIGLLTLIFTALMYFQSRPQIPPQPQFKIEQPRPIIPTQPADRKYPPCRPV